MTATQERQEMIQRFTVTTQRTYAIHGPDEEAIMGMAQHLEREAGPAPTLTDSMVLASPSGSSHAVALDRATTRVTPVVTEDSAALGAASLAPRPLGSGRGGRLIVLEGIDGAGTTTQARRLADRLLDQGRRVRLTREPSDGPIGQLIRQVLAGRHRLPDPLLAQLLTQSPRGMGPSTLALLFAADRADHLEREVVLMLDQGVIVVSDRWYHSSLAYQGSEVDRRWVSVLNHRAIRPDLTLFLQVDPEIAQGRRVAAGRSTEMFDDLATQRRVDAGYRDAIAELRAAGERVEVVDGELDPDRVLDLILGAVGPILAPIARAPDAAGAECE